MEFGSITFNFFGISFDRCNMKHRKRIRWVGIYMLLLTLAFIYIKWIFYFFLSHILFSRISQAEVTPELGQYEEAISLFDNIVATAANNRVLNFKLKNFLFHECLCLVGLDQIGEMHPIFNATILQLCKQQRMQSNNGKGNSILLFSEFKWILV